MSRRLLWLIPVLPVLIACYYAIGMVAAHKIDDDLDFAIQAQNGESRAAAAAAALILREVDVNKWVANDPFFKPSWLLDDMPAYQMGMVAGIAGFVEDLRALQPLDDPDFELNRAAGFLKYPGNVWKFDPSTSWAPTASSEKQYRAAARNVMVFNERLAAGEAHLSRDAAVLRVLLEQVAGDLDQNMDALAAFTAGGHSALFDPRSDDVFYDAKGRLYARFILTRELGWDFAQVISENGLSEAWGGFMAAWRDSLRIRPKAVMNGAADSLMVPNHLSNLGFALARTRLQLAALLAASVKSEH